MKPLIHYTERLLLKPTNAVEDALFKLELMNTPKWFKYIADRNIKSAEDAKNYIISKQTTIFGKLNYGNFIVIRKSDNVKIGSIGLYDREGVDGIDIGYAFLPEYEKQGYALESVTKLLEITIEACRPRKISAITLEINKGSQSLLEKLGFEFKELMKVPSSEDTLMLYVKSINDTQNLN